MANLSPMHRSLLLVFLAAVLLLVPPASHAGADGQKVDVCHVDETGAVRLIAVPGNAVPAHLRHGDHLPIAFYEDADGDDYGTSGSMTLDCVPPPGYAAVAGDCNDTDPSVNPGAEEVCDGQDNDCDGVADEDACGCGPCATSAECESGICYDGRCQPSAAEGVVPVPIASGGTVDAYVGCDGYVLLAHYGAGGRISGYSQDTSQQSSTSGGGLAPAGFYPTIDGTSYGHLAMTLFEPAGKNVRMSCAPHPGATLFSVTSNAFFGDFSSDTKGTYGDMGLPGWAMVAAIGSGEGRSSHAICGQVVDNTTGGIGYCSGPGSAWSWGNHLVSYYTTNQEDSPYMGCNGSGQSGIGSTVEMWLWLEP